MLIGGLQKLTLVDYPGKTATTVFTIGCNFACPFCHNPSLVAAQPNPLAIGEAGFFDWLSQRVGLLDGVVITGGEPTLHRDLVEFCRRIKELGFAVKLDTNGSRPDVIEILIEEGLLDYAAMDIKVPLDRYTEHFNPHVDPIRIKTSVELIRTLPNYEFRTTVVPALHSTDDFVKIGEWLDGSKRYFLQQFRPKTTLDPEFSEIEPYKEEELLAFKKILEPHFEMCEVRL